MDKTYAETQGKAPFDWNKWLDAAISLEPSPQDAVDKTVLASTWVTCACGNQCAIIPRASKSSAATLKGEPDDSELEELGMCFFRRVRDREWREAKQILVEIEARSAVLIAEELKKLNEQ